MPPSTHAVTQGNFFESLQTLKDAVKLWSMSASKIGIDFQGTNSLAWPKPRCEESLMTFGRYLRTLLKLLRRILPKSHII